MKTPSKARLTVIGDLGVDLVLGPIAEWPEIGTETMTKQHQLRPGGSAANTVLSLSALGQQCHFISAVGNDHFGQWLTTQFDQDTTKFIKINTNTSTSVGITHTCTERTFFTTTGHLNEFSYSPLSPLLPQKQCDNDIVLLSGVFLTPHLQSNYLQLLKQLKSRGFIIAIDIGWPPGGWSEALRRDILDWFKNCDIILLSKKEVTHLFQEEDITTALKKAHQFLPLNPQVIVKNGSQGALVSQDNNITQCKAEPVNDIQDTVGAGDSFNAGYLYGQLHQLTISSSLKLGCKVAAATISSKNRRLLDLTSLANFTTANNICFDSSK